MSRIVAGTFNDNGAADRAIAVLRRLGFGRADLDRFVLNPPGRHHGLPWGGDEDADRGAVGGEKGALAGVAIGAALGAIAGLIASPLIGPAAIAGGLAAGAYAGSLAGAVSSLGDPVEKGAASNVVRPAGVMVAVNAPLQTHEQAAGRALREAGARTIEWDEGMWRNGRWVDFDPVAQPRRIESYEDTRSTRHKRNDRRHERVTG
jgi:hypothetical protein